MDIIEIDHDVIMSKFIINLDALIRLGDNQANGDDDFERINAVLLRARKTYGIHFEGDETY
jgi:hypothetical protein